MTNYAFTTGQQLKESHWQEAKAKRQALLQAIRKKRAAAWKAQASRRHKALVET
jgi:hypothetical protein